MIRIAVIIGSTRPGRNGEAVAKWVYEIARKRSDAEFELVDIKDFNLPLLDEPVPPSLGQYTKEHTKVWAAKIDSFDAYVFVTPEYNHGISGALKNAIDFLFKEWNNKAAGFVSYGALGGTRAVELQPHLLDCRRPAQGRRHRAVARLLPAHRQGLPDRRGGTRLFGDAGRGGALRDIGHAGRGGRACRP